MKKILMILTVCLCVVPSIVWAEGENTPAPGQDTQPEEAKEEANTPKQDKKEGQTGEKGTNGINYVFVPQAPHYELTSPEILKKDKSSANLFGIDLTLKDDDGVPYKDKLNSYPYRTIDSYSTIDMENTDDPLFRSQYNRTVDIKKLCKAKKGVSANDGQHDPDCAFISKDFGICDTHAYNAGFYSNPTTAEEKERMREIIAAKITVISQQMYKQYEYLNATLTRLEKQLQKAVTTAELEMASGKSDSDSSSYSSSSSKETPLAGSENCMYAGGGLKTYECLNRNLMLIQSNIETNRSQAKKQLEKDYGIAKTFGIDACYAYEGDTLSACKQVNEKGEPVTKKEARKDYLPCYTDNLKTKDGIKKCANKLTMAVQRAMDKENKDLLQYSNRRY